MSGPGEPSFDETAWDEAVAQIDRADELIAAGSLAEGLRLAVDAAGKLEPVVGADHPDYAQALVSEGDALSALGRMSDALARFEAALAILEPYLEDAEAAPIVQPRRLSVLGRIGYLEALAGHYQQAERHLIEAIDVAIAVHGQDAPELSEHHNTLGVCLRFAGRYDEALAAYGRAGELRAKAGIPQPASHFHNLSGLATARGDHAAAELHAREAIAMRTRDEGPGFELGTDLCGLGDALVGLGRPAEAEAVYREALALYAASPRADHPEVAFALHNLADALTEQGRASEAEAAYRDSIARKVVAFGEDSHEVAATLNNVAALLSELGRTDEARTTIARAVAICDAVLPPEHPISVACHKTAARV